MKPGCDFIFCSCSRFRSRDLIVTPLIFDWYFVCQEDPILERSLGMWSDRVAWFSAIAKSSHECIGVAVARIFRRVPPTSTTSTFIELSIRCDRLKQNWARNHDTASAISSVGSGTQRTRFELLVRSRSQWKSAADNNSSVGRQFQLPSA